MANRDIVVIGASAGGIETVTEVLRELPGNFPASILFVLHMNPETPTTLPQILQRHTLLPVKAAEDGESLEPGTVYVAVPDRHLMLERGRVCVVSGPRNNRHRPSIDNLFFSAAAAYGPRVIGVILTGLLDDGALGLAAIKRAGGRAIVQQPEDALFDSMPRSAIDADSPDYVLPSAAIPGQLRELLRESVEEREPVPLKAVASGFERLPRSHRWRHRNLHARKEDTMDADENVANEQQKPGDPSVYTCPECSGTLWEVRNGKAVRYECRVGHKYSELNLAEAHREAVENALWVALRTLEENASLAKRMAEHARQRDLTMVATRWEETAEKRAREADVLRDILYTETDTVAVNQ